MWRKVVSLAAITAFFGQGVLISSAEAQSRTLNKNQKIIKSRLLMSEFYRLCVDSRADLEMVRSVAKKRDYEDLAPAYRQVDLPGYKTDNLFQAEIKGGSGKAIPYALFLKETETTNVCGVQVQQLPGPYLAVGLEKSATEIEPEKAEATRRFCVTTGRLATIGHEILFTFDKDKEMTLVRAEFGKTRDDLKGCPPYNRPESGDPEFLTVGAVDW